MRRAWGITLLMGTCVGLFLVPQHAFAQSCKDEVTMVEGSRQALAELTATVKTEGLKPFENLNHQKSAVNKLALHDSMLGELVTCLETAAHDPALTKEEVAAQHKKRKHLLFIPIPGTVDTLTGPPLVALASPSALAGSPTPAWAPGSAGHVSLRFVGSGAARVH